MDVLTGVTKEHGEFPNACTLGNALISPGVYKALHAPAPGPHCLPPSPAELRLHLHTPSNGLWFAVVPEISLGKSESPCPRTITGGGGEQVDS